MHGVQGGQTPNDHTGRSGQNKLWGERGEQSRLAWLWAQIAKRYRNRSAVVAYDTLNEPYGGAEAGDQGDLRTDATGRSGRSTRTSSSTRRATSTTSTTTATRRRTAGRNVGFQMHYYPGLFGGGDPTIRTQAKHFRRLESVAGDDRRLNVPFLVGEMNVVFERAGGAPMMRRTFDLHAAYGWATTMWSYKVLDARRQQAEATLGDGRQSRTRAEDRPRRLRARPRSRRTSARSRPMELVPYRELQRVLTAKNPRIYPPLPPEPPPATYRARRKTHRRLEPRPTSAARSKEASDEAERRRSILYGGGRGYLGRAATSSVSSTARSAGRLHRSR